ncbi:MAG: succinate dehydrogenase cytochrome b subunit [Bacteroidales bacterium]|nr:succinate dehydrogenase cytochrome b subunit [Bacteroidales bacterium]MDD4030930.1 succinate dehydrogenase cytochrome b subunit [Bacteroidales bacterium]MDD4435656.1 succinate dehydrogenase cytochrome b subunit [Bacteroidales bacterium]MDD5733816.1 succinate dehydrogenase cytochrome b subunit [Bacteroidales bacterium]
MSSSITKKAIMSVTGLFLILFLTLHVTANLTILWGQEAYDAVTEFMGTNPLVQIMVPVLALGFVIHIGYSLILNLKNLKARGPVTYAGGMKSRGYRFDRQSSQNMLLLGVIVLGFLILHLSQFWIKMQWQQLSGGEPQNGYLLVTGYLGTPWVAICYIAWFAALWFHINHGFWSAFQTLGLNNQRFLPILRTVSVVYSSLLFVGFTTIVAWCMFF